MTGHPARPPATRAVRIAKFLRTPKGLLTIVLVVLVVLAAPVEGLTRVGPGLAGAVLIASAIDAVVLRIRAGVWVFPSGALLSGMIVAMVLSAHEPWSVVTLTAALAIASKYVFRTRSANVFNPAALAIVATFYVFQTGQDWWGALAAAAPLMIVVLVATGIFIADRVNKMPLVVAFLGIYFLLFTIAAFVRDPVRVAEIFRPPDLQAVLFFAFFILTDPPTSPVRYADQIVCAAIVAVTSFGIFQWSGAAHYLLSGVLVGNVWEARRRVRARRLRHQPHRLPPARS